MARRTGMQWGPVLRPLVVLLILLGFAYLVRGSVWMTGALIFALVATAFLVVAIVTQIPERKRK